MKKHSNITIGATEVRLVICNMCAKDIDIKSRLYVDNHISIEKIWHYGSPFDGETHSIDLCTDCYSELVDMLKIKPFFPGDSMPSTSNFLSEFPI